MQFSDLYSYKNIYVLIIGSCIQHKYFVVVIEFCLFKFCHETLPRSSVIFAVHRQTMQTQIRRHMMRRLIRFSTVCLKNVPLKFSKK